MITLGVFVAQLKGPSIQSSNTDRKAFQTERRGQTKTTKISGVHAQHLQYLEKVAHLRRVQDCQGTIITSYTTK